MTDTIKITKAEYDALKKDAERYAFIRGKFTQSNCIAATYYELIPSGTKRLLDIALDQAIDTAIGEKK